VRSETHAASDTQRESTVTGGGVMNPKLAWEELKAKMADNRRAVEHVHLVGEAHRACQACGSENSEHAVACAVCGARLQPKDSSAVGNDVP